MAIAPWGEGVYVAGMTKEPALPNDLAACHAIIRMQAQQLEEERARVAKAEAERDAALQLAFRKKIERYLPDPKQFVLDFGDSPEVVDAAEGIADAALETIAGYERRKQATEKARSEQLPAHLPRYEVKLDVPEDQKACVTHGERQVIGYDWQETLEVVPPNLVVRRTGIPKLACPKAPECGVVEAPGRSASWKAIGTTRAWRPRSWLRNTPTTCPCIASKTCSRRASGRRPGARS